MAIRWQYQAHARPALPPEVPVDRWMPAAEVPARRRGVAVALLAAACAFVPVVVVAETVTVDKWFQVTATPVTAKRRSPTGETFAPPSRTAVEAEAARYGWPITYPDAHLRQDQRARRFPSVFEPPSRTGIELAVAQYEWTACYPDLYLKSDPRARRHPSAFEPPSRTAVETGVAQYEWAPSFPDLFLRRTEVVASGNIGGRRVAVAAATAAAYDPANYFTGGSKVAWWPAWDATMVLDASNASAADTVSVKTVTDAWLLSHDLVQATGADQATCRKNSIGGTLQTIEYASASGTGYVPASFDSVLNSASVVTVGLVHSIADTATNHEAFFCYDNSYNFPRLKAYFTADQWSADWNTVDGSSQGNQTASGATVIATGNTTYHASLWEFDLVNGVINMYSDAALKKTATYAGSAGSIPNTILKEPHCLRSYKGRVADLFMYKNVKMTSPQRDAWFADVKAKFSLAGY